MIGTKINDINSIIPPKSDEIWERILCDELMINFEFLAIKILLARLKLTIKLNPEPNLINECISEFRNLIVKTRRLPSVQRDLNKIIKGAMNK